MEEVVGVNVVETGENLVQYALDTPCVHTFVFSCLHQLIKVAIHVFHANMEFFTERIQEDVQRRYQVGMVWEGS